MGPGGSRSRWRATPRLRTLHPVCRPQPIQPSNGRFYSLQPPPPGPATQGGSLAARGPPQGRSGSRAPAHPCAAGRGGQDEVTIGWSQGGGGVLPPGDTAGAPGRIGPICGLVGADFAKNSCFCPATREGGRQNRCRILKARKARGLTPPSGSKSLVMRSPVSAQLRPAGDSSD